MDNYIHPFYNYKMQILSNFGRRFLLKKQKKYDKNKIIQGKVLLPKINLIQEILNQNKNPNVLKLNIYVIVEDD